MRKTLYFLIITFFAHNLVAQNISGFVKNEEGIPISNALVTHSDDLSIWTKTTSDGSFLLPGNSNKKLRIAALHYETIPAV